MAKKNKLIGPFRITEEQDKRFHAAADKNDQTLVEWVREQLNRASKKALGMK